MKKTPRLLNSEDKEVIRFVFDELCNRQLLEYGDLTQLAQYLTEGYRQNKNGTLIYNQGGRWVDNHHGYRDGADTINGTVDEYVYKACERSRGNEFVFLHGEYDQKVRHLDGILCGQEDGLITVKRAQRGNNIRQGRDYYPVGSEATHIAFVVAKELCSYKFPYAEALDYFEKHKHEGRENEWTYVDVNHMLHHASGVKICLL